ncbi:hypothetical protein PGT21_028022 [Puccinia graminis f. sp. tritici]|uniref:Uncharacterized protein n=1 Tax=Puccinia graminis f. sp. tritici TaxID=56615 RepID=A0A5B0LPJ5_PUCGR|nr:hypothetical protein PGT21_028022 [Puccinia graminis f. sp. tritici]
MNLYLGYSCHMVLFVISCFLQMSECMDALEKSGKAIRKTLNSISSSNMVISEAKNSDTGASVILPEVTEAELKKYLETVNPLYKQDILFPDISQAKSFRDDFISMKRSLAKTKDLFNAKIPSDQMKIKENRELHEKIETLDSFHELILDEIQYRLYKSKDKKSDKVTIEMDDVKPQTNDSKHAGKQENFQMLTMSRYWLWGWPKSIQIFRKYQEFLPLKSAESHDSEPPESKFKKDPRSGDEAPREYSFPGAGLGQDMVDSIRKKVLEIQAVKLNELLHQVGSFKVGNKICPNHAISIILQNNIIQTVSYMYRHNMITKNAMKSFYETNSTLEITALSMILNYLADWIPMSYISTHPTIKTIPTYDFSHYMSLFEVLEGKQLRYSKYLCLKAFLRHRCFNDQFSQLYGKIFENDQLFFILERYHGSGLIPEEEESKGFIWSEPMNLIEIKKKLQGFIDSFQDDGSSHLKSIKRKESYHVLEFIEDNYPANTLGLQKGPLLKDKIKLMSSRFQLCDDLSVVLKYLRDLNGEFEDLIPPDSVIKKLDTQKESQIKRFCKAFLMISKYFQLIILKNQEAFSSPQLGMKIYSLIDSLERIRVDFDEDHAKFKLQLKEIIQQSDTSDNFLNSFVSSI